MNLIDLTRFFFFSEQRKTPRQVQRLRPRLLRRKKEAAVAKPRRRSGQRENQVGIELNCMKAIVLLKKLL